AAPWSFELPPGYTEVPTAGDPQLEQMRRVPGTVSLDAQVYLSREGDVQLTRMTVETQPDEAPTRALLEGMERGAVRGLAAQGAKHVSDEFHLVGNQLVAETIDESDTVRMHARRMYSADTSGVVHMFEVTCSGPISKLAACEKAQQTMQLTLPNEAPLGAAT